VDEKSRVLDLHGDRVGLMNSPSSEFSTTYHSTLDAQHSSVRRRFPLFPIPYTPNPIPRVWSFIIHHSSFILSLVAIALVGILAGLPSLPEPFGVDQGIYGYIGERILDGAVNYRDVFDHKPPGIHYAYAAAFALFGHKMSSVRLLDLLAAIATAFGLYALGRQWAGSRMGLICGLLYLVFYEGAFDWMSRGQPEAWVNLMFVTGLALLSLAKTRGGIFGAGVLLGAGFWFKPTVLPLAAIWLAILFYRARVGEYRGLKPFVWDLLAVGSGFLILFMYVLVEYLVKDALGALYEAVVSFNVRYHTRLDRIHGWREVCQSFVFILRPLYGLALPALAAVAVTALPPWRRSVLLGFSWLMLAFTTVFWQGSFAKSHYVLVLPALTFLAALALDQGIAATNAFAGMLAGPKNPQPGGTMPKWIVVLAAIATVACVAVLVLNINGLFSGRWVKFSALVAKRISLEEYYASFWLKGAPGRGGYSFEDLREMAAYLEGQTSPDQTVYVWGFRPIVAWLAHRRMPTRFIFRYPLTRTNNPRWWNQFLTDLDRSPPAFFVVVLDDRGLYHPEPSKEALESNGALSLFLHNRYELDRTMTDFEIYRLRRSAPR
jgi:4-amino-4-deoxy-L-arabinose transferase-like glycosyltransferase